MVVESEIVLQPERNKWRERLAVALLIALVASISAGIWWQRYTGTPEYSLAALGRAVRDKLVAHAVRQATGLKAEVF